MYSKEDCGRNDPSMSPGSRSGRGAMSLTPAPNGAKEFSIAFLNVAVGIEHGALDAYPLCSSSWSTRPAQSGVREERLVGVIVNWWPRITENGE